MVRLVWLTLGCFEIILRGTDLQASDEGAGPLAKQAIAGRPNVATLSDRIVIDEGRIANYQVITPKAWNIGPRDACDGKAWRERSRFRIGEGA